MQDGRRAKSGKLKRRGPKNGADPKARPAAEKVGVTPILQVLFQLPRFSGRTGRFIRPLAPSLSTSLRLA